MWGKTTLARHAGLHVAGRFPSGTDQADLTRMDAADAVPDALAAQLRFDSSEALLSAPSNRAEPVVGDDWSTSWQRWRPPSDSCWTPDRWRRS